jgi:hypothetical protein
MKRFVIPLLALAMLGCATVHLDCSSGTPQTFAITGSTVGSQLLAVGIAAAKGAGFAATAPPTTTPQGSTLDYSYVPIFGSDSGGLGCGATQPATTTINNNQGGTLNMQSPR